MNMESIGELIRLRLKEDGHSVSWFARKLSCTRANAYKIFKKDNLDILLLLRISQILNHDFFSYFSEELEE